MGIRYVRSLDIQTRLIGHELRSLLRIFCSRILTALPVGRGRLINATLVCSSPDVCKNIRAENISVVSPSGTDDAICTNMGRSLLDLHCAKG
ncbi:uncharacterized protein P174DRAFT_286734 [Aspergillus novofumigatus IBT 16806]|uniref:Uncharacterized protein n=1 Tax=Aspergillus novofumigatus (strain IBT 16806) TaxID=1392255 RepID=A0A2I1C0V7_ASPN1|nr:uncharacterized protein P174DRAFT_286734 [Aspergillus novofumigatus IBT 16806]PKX91276.1 hypothetical protein P174DRAFT_286734 [Aspergillus novofumigatus IBT 16806]